MKPKKALFYPLALFTSILLACALRLPAQTAPTITTQPASQTNQPGTTVTFTVAVTGTGPFTCQWLFNGVSNIITTVAGNGTATYSGDGGPAASASLNYPHGVAFDAVGNQYIADSDNDRIRRVGTNGIITTVAGNGSYGFSGDGGAAANAELDYPEGVVLDSAGNLYIADEENQRIRKVDINGIITTVAGLGVSGYSGDGGAATNAELYYPDAEAVDDAGNLYIADSEHSRIRRVDTNGIITTVAGKGISGFSGDGGAATNASLYTPSGVAVDSSGNLYIADEGNSRIRRVATNGIITTVAGNGNWGYSGDGGAATNASLDIPSGVAVDAFGNLYIVDQDNNRIRKVAPNGIITTVAGKSGESGYSGDGGAATNASLFWPAGVGLDAAGNLYVADTQNQRIREVHSTANPVFTLTPVNALNAGNYTVVITSPYGSVTSVAATLTVATPAAITLQPANQFAVSGGNATFSVAVAGSGPFGYAWYFDSTNLVQSGTNNILRLSNVTTNEAGNYTVVITNNYGSVTSQVATLTLGVPPSVTLQPVSQTNLAGSTLSFNVTAGGPGPFSYQWQFNGVNLPNLITTVAGGGTSGLGDGGPATNASLDGAFGVALDVSGNLYIADTYNNRIRKVNLSGLITTVAGNGSAAYAGDGGPATNASLDSPQSVALDPAGNLYIADLGNNRIRRVAPNGLITTVAGNGAEAYAGDGGAATNASLYAPAYVACDACGNLYIGNNGNSWGVLGVADGGNNRIRRVDTNGIITTVVGNGDYGYSGDGGAATNASLMVPASVALDAAGNLYFVDSANDRIRRVDTNGIITTVAGNGEFGYTGDGGPATNACLYGPSGVACDAFGNLYIADTSNDSIRQVTPNGLIATVAGNGEFGYSGDGGPATAASLCDPAAVACDAFGNLSIADTGNGRIRAVHLADNPTFSLTGVSAANAGNYSVVITSPYGSVTSAVAMLTIAFPPAISTQPASQVALAGGSASFSVAASGTLPLNYSWYLAGTNLVQSGANSTLLLTNVSTVNAGNYTVVISNNYGSVTSQVSALTVAISPTVAAQPAGQTNLPGTTASFSVAVTGTGPFTYQWLFNGVSNIITTVAGNGSATYSGDGGPAASASLDYPCGVAFDASGNLYIADQENDRIRRLGTNGIITTVAGNGSYGYSGDGGTATNASLDWPSGVAFDASGNLYIADEVNNRIRKVATNGLITTVAGNGNYDDSGDGGAATNASLAYPAGVATDASANLYIADQNNNCIRKVDTNGFITTVAGNGSYGYFGDGGAATNACLACPTGLAFDASGNLYIADEVNNRIRKVATNGLITTVAGKGPSYPSGGRYAGDGGAATNASLYYPYGVALDAAGNLYIADQDNNRIRKVSPNGLITTVVGNGSEGYSGDGCTATNASLFWPAGVGLDAAGNLYVADTHNQRIREVYCASSTTFALTSVSATNAGNYTVVITSPYGSVTSAAATLTVAAPAAITLQPANQFAVSGGNSAFSVAVAGSGPFGYAWYFDSTNLVQSGANNTLTLLNVATNEAGNYFVVITNNYGSVTSQVAALTLGVPPTVTTQPVSQTNLAGATASFNVTAGGPGPFTYQWQFNGTNLPNIITTVAGNGSCAFSGDGAAATNAGLWDPTGVAFDVFGNLYIADLGNNRIRRVDTNGRITSVAGNGNEGYAGDGGAATNASLNYPAGVALDVAGSLYIADAGNNRIRRVDTNGIITTVAGNGKAAYAGDTGAATNASVAPAGVATDTFGNLYIADSLNNRIRKVDTNGIITTLVGNGGSSYSGDGGPATNASIWYPSGVALDAASILFIADEGNNRIRRVDTNGLITTVAGNGIWGYSGDGGAATNASLYNPQGMAFDAAGNLYIADYQNNRIRLVATSGIITTGAGNGVETYAGDGGVATNASLFYPVGVALDAFGNLYIADTDNSRIREVHLAGNPTFSLTGVSAANVGNYSVVITSPYGSVTSAVATLTIALPPVISTQPASQVTLAGGSASFSVAASGTLPLNYSWYLAGTNVVQSGANSTLTLPIVAENEAGDYTVVITNNYGSVTSQVAVLTVAIPPTVAAQPVSQTNQAGTTVNFNVTASGTGPFSNQWQLNGTNFPNNIISTVAGNGSATYVGDGGAAINASLYGPSGVAVDASGNLYIADCGNYRIRKVGINGTMTTMAGNGNWGYSGDGGAATNASLDYPTSVALDAFGNLYIADSNNQRIRKVDPNGLITTVAGNGSYGYSGDGGAATNASLNVPSGVALDTYGNLYIADRNNSRVRKVNPSGIITTVAGNGSYNYAGDGGPATNASLYGPSGVAVDASGNLYIADYGNYRIRKVGTNGIITTVAGNGNWGYSGDGGAATNASFYYPLDVACDAFGNLYIADVNNCVIRQVTPNGLITTVAGNGIPGHLGDGGAATNASLDYPTGVGLDAAGNLYIADTDNERIRAVSFTGHSTNLVLLGISAYNAGNYTVVITSPYGSVTSVAATLTVATPAAITLQPANQFAVSGGNSAFSVAVAGSGPFGYAWFFDSTNLVQSGANNTLTLLNVATNEAGNYFVVITNSYGSVTSQVAALTLGVPPTVTTQPVSQTNLAGFTANFNVTASGPGPFTYQWQFKGTNLPNGLITTLAGNGSYGYSGDGGAATNASLNVPSGVALDTYGNLYIADRNNNRVRKVNPSGIITTVAGNGIRSYAGDGGPATNASLYFPTGVALDAAGNLYIADCGNNRIRRVDTNGLITTVAGNGTGTYAGDGGAATNASLYFPTGVACDAFGNLYVADSYNNRLRMVGANGIITTVAGGGNGGDGGMAPNASLHYPSGAAFDAAGNLYIVDQQNNRLRRVDTNGIITTVAGNGTAAYAGDGGAAIDASLDEPTGVALDAAGNLYIADQSNQRIRKVDTGGTITTVAGGGSTNPGNGGAATNASLYFPTGVACDAFGNLYIADTDDSRIRKVLLYAGQPTLTLGQVSAANVGNYSVVITSPYGSVTSAVATLTIALPPVISTQPASQVTLAGGSASFSVAASGTLPLNYSWYLAGTNLVQSGPSSTLPLTNVSAVNAGPYLVVITNVYGSVTSSVAMLTLELPPTVATQPAGQTNLAGTTARFTVTVGGTGPFSYQWLFNGLNLPNSNLITTVTGTTSLDKPEGVTFDAAGNLYIADTDSSAIVKVATNGTVTTVVGSGLDQPTGVALDAAGNLYIACWLQTVIIKFGTNGISTNLVSGLGTPTEVALDAAGDLYIAEQGANRILKLNAGGGLTTVAGTGVASFSGDGGAATSATLNGPFAVTLDGAGSLYISDQNNNRIRKVNTNGIITTVAGNGTAAFAGDGGAATNASLYYPRGMAFDAAGNLFVADNDNNRIRRVATNGLITTVAGNGTATYAGDGAAAVNASLYNPMGLAFDAFNLYIADADNNRIREVNFAGYPTLTLSNVTVANAGNYSVVITSPYGSVTSLVATLTWPYPPAISTPPAGEIAPVGSSPSLSVAVVGSGPFGYEWYLAGTNLVQSGTNNTLTLPDVAANQAGNYTVVVTNNYGSVTSQVATLTVALPPTVAAQPVSQTNLAGSAVAFNVTVGGTGPFACQWQFNGANLPNNLITTVAGNGTATYAGDGGFATNASLYYPSGVACDAFGNMYIADTDNNRIRMVNTSGLITTVAGKSGGGYSGDGGAATNAGLDYPLGVALDAAGNLYIADQYNDRIRRVAPNGLITTVAGKSGGGYSGDGGAATNANLYYPSGVALDAFGNLYIADQDNNRIRLVSPNGLITTMAGKSGSGYSGDSGAATNANLYYPSGVALDAAGNLYIADHYNNRIRRVDTNSLITTVAGKSGSGYSGDGGAAINATLYYPSGVALDPVGNLYIADTDNNRIRMVTTKGLITTVAGNGSFGYSGDGGAATNASLRYPKGVALDAVGNLYIADYENNCIREVHFAGFPALTLPTVTVANAGNYSVIITSPYGSVTSAVVSLTVTIPTTSPQIISSGTNFGFLTNQFGFNLNGAYGQTIVVDGSTNLLDWTPLFTNTANGSPFYFYDPTWTNFPWRFYRARLP